MLDRLVEDLKIPIIRIKVTEGKWYIFRRV